MTRTQVFWLRVEKAHHLHLDKKSYFLFFEFQMKIDITNFIFQHKSTQMSTPNEFAKKEKQFLILSHFFSFLFSLHQPTIKIEKKIKNTVSTWKLR